MPGAPTIPGRPTSIPSVLDPSVFKAYDVRGIYPSQLDEDGAYRVARAYTAHFEPRSVALGHDMRLSSPSMARAAAEGIADAGADVVELGLVGTEMLYHAVTELGLDGGICVTASHNPKEYTGMKIVRRGALPVGGDSGLSEIRVLAESGFDEVTSRGSIQIEDVWLSFVQKVLSFVDVDAIRPLRVVIDAANGMAGVMLPPVLEKLPQLDLVRCYFEPDGNFPNHEPNPLLPENREFIVRKVTEEGADLGVAYDGDADRCFFVDDTGQFVPGDFATALMAEAMLGEGAGREGPLRRASELGRSGDDRTGRRHAARESGRARVHQAAHARRGRPVRRRGVRALLLPRVLTGRHWRRAVSRDARARVPKRDASCPISCDRTASGSSSRARSTRPCRTWR